MLNRIYSDRREFKLTYSKAPPNTPTRPDCPLWSVPFSGGISFLIWSRICFETVIPAGKRIVEACPKPWLVTTQKSCWIITDHWLHHTSKERAWCHYHSLITFTQPRKVFEGKSKKVFNIRDITMHALYATQVINTWRSPLYKYEIGAFIHFPRITVTSKSPKIDWKIDWKSCWAGARSEGSHG